VRTYARALTSPTHLCVGNQTPGAIQGTRVEGVEHEVHRPGLQASLMPACDRDEGDPAFLTLDSERGDGNLLLR
jgi:hypothetical protein